MRGACRVQNKALGVAHVGKVREQFDVVNYFDRRFIASLDAEHHHAAEPVFQVSRGQ